MRNIKSRLYLGTLLFIGVGILVAGIFIKQQRLATDMYTVAGMYDIHYGNKLRIDNTEDRVNYEILDSNDEQLISNRYYFDNKQNWYIVSDAAGSVWVHSSDIGDVVYKRSPENTYEEIEMTPELCKTSPDSFKNNLPVSIKTILNC